MLRWNLIIWKSQYVEKILILKCDFSHCCYEWSFRSVYPRSGPLDSKSILSTWFHFKWMSRYKNISPRKFMYSYSLSQQFYLVSPFKWLKIARNTGQKHRNLRNLSAIALSNDTVFPGLFQIRHSDWLRNRLTRLLPQNC